MVILLDSTTIIFSGLLVIYKLKNKIYFNARMIIKLEIC